ncbi:hypothetical protein HS7_17450 [Sulfolobales archaeon HS-7]|nr:hypothetical protein HS7_17450 [Sulfolobales archaeon HS-7]
MSQQAISLEEVLAAAEQLKAYIENLQNVLNELGERLESITSSKEAIAAIPNKTDYIVSLDKRGYALAKVTGFNIDKIYVYLGLNYYAFAQPQDVIKLLDREEEDVKKSIESVQGELAKAVNEYNRISAILQQARESLDSEEEEPKGA